MVAVEDRVGEKRGWCARKGAGQSRPASAASSAGRKSGARSPLKTRRIALDVLLGGGLIEGDADGVRVDVRGNSCAAPRRALRMQRGGLGAELHAQGVEEGRRPDVANRQLPQPPGAAGAVSA